MNFENSVSFAKQLDKNDPLKDFRQQFIIPSIDGKEQIYFLGNSLGLQPKKAKDELNKILGQWSVYGVEGFFKGDDPWIDYHDKLTKPLAKIVGALPHEISVMNQLTVNLHLMMVSFYNPNGKRNKIICEAKAFPSDQYMFETHVRHYGFNPDDTIIEVQPRKNEYAIHTEDILLVIEQHKDEVALVLFSGVNYYSGQLFDIPTITAAAQKAGAKVGFDLAHAAGNVSLQLHEWNVDFACWCSYKYLNAGPGAVGAIYIHERFHNDKNIARYGGWWGYNKATRFKMDKGFKPINTAEGWQLSTPTFTSLALYKAALDIFEQAGWENILAKRKLLNDYLWFVLNEIKIKGAFEIITPKNEKEKGCQVSLLMPDRGKTVFDELAKAGIMVDWREPNVIRLAPVPLYNSFEEVWQFGNILRQILKK
ncbi:MAG: kynureninase [Bacteroidetes bacterium]|nr:MAG: kynureninase [Bacteroidota bacterium]